MKDYLNNVIKSNEEEGDIEENVANVLDRTICIAKHGEINRTSKKFSKEICLMKTSNYWYVFYPVATDEGIEFPVPEFT